jgi:hypothetical protein
MGIQDKIFDVEAALEAHGDAGAIKDFDDLMTLFAEMERKTERQSKVLNDLSTGLAALSLLQRVADDPVRRW